MQPHVSAILIRAHFGASLRNRCSFMKAQFSSPAAGKPRTSGQAVVARTGRCYAEEQTEWEIATANDPDRLALDQHTIILLVSRTAIGIARPLVSLIFFALTNR